MIVTHVAAPPMAGSNRAAVRHTSRRTSWATSSDWDGSRRTFLMTPYTGPTIRSYSVSNASWSPRATWTSRSSRSRSPLLSAVAGLNRDASESFGFIWHLRGPETSHPLSFAVDRRFHYAQPGPDRSGSSGGQHSRGSRLGPVPPGLAAVALQTASAGRRSFGPNGPWFLLPETLISAAGFR